jgi:hypothetical protein
MQHYAPPERRPAERLQSSHFALVPQLVQDRPCKSAFVSSTLTRGLLALSSKWSGNQPFKLRIRVRLPLALYLVLSSSGLRRYVVSVDIAGSNPVKTAISACRIAAIARLCKSCVVRLRWFESNRADHYFDRRYPKLSVY